MIAQEPREGYKHTDSWCYLPFLFWMIKKNGGEKETTESDYFLLGLWFQEHDGDDKEF